MMEWCPAIWICHTGILTAATGGSLLVGDFRILHDFGHKINPAGMQKTTELMTDMYQKQYRHGFNRCFYNRFHPSLRDLKLPGVVFTGLPNAFWAVLAAPKLGLQNTIQLNHPILCCISDATTLRIGGLWWNPTQPSITPPACRCRHHCLKSMGWVKRRETPAEKKNDGWNRPDLNCAWLFVWHTWAWNNRSHANIWWYSIISYTIKNQNLSENISAAKMREGRKGVTFPCLRNKSP